MAKYYLRTSAKEGNANLYLRIQKPNQKINWWVNTGIIVDIQSWSKAQTSVKALQKYNTTEEGQRVAELTAKVNALTKDFFKEKRADDEKSILESQISLLVNGGVISAVEKANEQKKANEESEMCKILTYFDYFFNGISEGSIRHKGKVYRTETLRMWKNFGKYLKRYCKRTDTFDDINQTYSDKFTYFLENEGIMAKTINKQILCFRRLCHSAYNDEKTENHRAFEVWNELPVKENEKRAEIALSDAEIDALYNLELQGLYEKVRDVWMLGFLTAQRVSDYSHFSRENFVELENGLKVIKFYQQKTDNEVVIPVVDERVLELCEKYDFNFPCVDTYQLNRVIKIVLEKLSDDVPSLKDWCPTVLTIHEKKKENTYLQLKEKAEKGELEDIEKTKYYKKLKEYALSHGDGSLLFFRDSKGNVLRHRYELVGSHTARRSGVTSLYNTNILDTRDLMSISGHSSMKNFELYIRRSKEEQAMRIAEKLMSKNDKKGGSK